MKYYLFLTLAVLFWSGNFIFGRLVASSIEPTELSFYRWFFVSLLFLPYFLINIKKFLKILKKNFSILLLLATLGVAGFNTVLYYALQTTTSINALLINSTTPIIIVALSALILKVKITKIQLFGIFLSTLGVVYLVLKGSLEYLYILEFTQGDFWILFASTIWAFYSIFLKFKPKEIEAFDFLVVTTFLGTIILSLVFFLQGYSFNFEFVSNSRVLYSLIYMILFPSILSFYFWNTSTIVIGANKAGQFTHLMPIFGSFLAYIFLDEKLQSYHLGGVVLIALGIYFSIFYYSRDIKDKRN